MRIRQVDHALNLLEIFARDRVPMTLTAISKALEIPKSSTFNLIETLVDRGFMYEVSLRGGYYPTRKLKDLSSSIMEGETFLQIVRDELQMLARETNETVVLATREHAEIVYLDVVEAEAQIRYFAKVGERRPIHLASSGKAILMAYDPATRERIVRSLKNDLPASVDINEDALLAELTLSARRGWSEDRGKMTADVLGLGASIKIGNRLLGLALAGPVYRMGHNQAALVETLLTTAQRIYAMVGDR